MQPELKIASFGYHDVTDDATSSGFERPAAAPYKLGCDAFRGHLDRFAAAPCAPTLACDIEWSRPGRHLLLTFDDGGKSAVHAADELCRRGWRGHFFIVTSRIGNRTFLDASEIRYLRSCGHVIGSHSHTHPDIFREQTVDQMAEEWLVSCDTLAALLGSPCDAASVPGGDISPAVLQSAADAGLRYLFTSEAWLRPRTVDACRVLGRFAPKTSTTPGRVQELAQFRGWGRARAVRELKVLAHRVLAPVYRWQVARDTRERPSAADGVGSSLARR